MVKKAVDTLRESDGLSNANIILVESNLQSKYNFDVDHYIIPDIPFNYNAYLNIGIKYAKSKYTCISNNDIVFSKTWWTKLKNAMEKYDLDIASPKSTMKIQEHNVKKDYFKHMYTPETLVKIELKKYSFAGWCFTITDEVRDWLFPLDERFVHYHQDMDLLMIFNERNCKHGFVPASKVLHFGNSSSDLIPGGKNVNLVNSYRIFHDKWAGHDMSFMEID
jgi:GT2 family glycosyltransferase